MHIIGHQVLRERLRQLALRAVYPQAFLFTGPESVGKRLVALEFAWRCLGQEGGGTVPEDASWQHPDVALLEPERVTEKGKTREKNIPVEAVREQLAFLSRYPLTGKKRILIIDDAHRLSLGAQNALLKTLEEPNATSVLILITHDAASLLGTVHSRVQRVVFSLVSEEQLRSFFPKRLAVDQEFLCALGRPGIVSQALTHSPDFVSREALLQRLARFESSTLAERLALAEDLAKDPAGALCLLEWWAPSERHRARAATTSAQIFRGYAFLEALGETVRILRGTQANARLQLEKLFLSA